MPMPRLALHGRPGAGKSTFAGLLLEELRAAGATSIRIKVGAPLYEIQAVILSAAGRPLLDRDEQDGRLLNLLGAEMRRINPEALTDTFAARVREAEQRLPDAVLICDDVRAPDADRVVELGFRLVQITARDEVRRARKALRGDLSAGDEAHSTEGPLAVAPWRCIVNDGDLTALRGQARALVAEEIG
ncbi:hypothetical protein ACWCOW_34890 [Streptomyces sp. NPDC001939]